MSTQQDKDTPRPQEQGIDEDDEGAIVRDPAPPPVDIDTDVRALGGAWAALADGGTEGATVKGLLGALPPNNARWMADGRGSVMNFLGDAYKREQAPRVEDEEVDEEREACEEED
ncbi:hypothetical protein DXG01_017050 [Tephrocybe rancida]|nr:hypothetical protein DXG01_017050 [Tephrocybe rancida]